MFKQAGMYVCYLLSKDGEICITDIDPDKVNVLGTPEELQSFLDE